MKKVASFLVLMLALSLLAVPVQAKEINLFDAGMPGAKIDPSIIELESVDYRFGFRSVDISGNEDMYKTDINLDEGFRLLNLDLTFVPGTDEAEEYLDVARLSLGDIADPTPTYSIQAKKYGLYDFGVKRSEREYFYNNASKDTKEDVNDTRQEYDLVEYDFTRTRDSMHLTVAPDGLPEFYISNNRLEKEGIAKIPQEAYGTHGVYQMNTPLNQISEDTTVGTEFSYVGFDFNLAHTEDSYNANSIQTVGEPFDSSNDNIGKVDGYYYDQESRNLDRAIDEVNVHKIFEDKLDVTLHLKDTRGSGSFATGGYIKSAIGAHGPYDEGDYEGIDVDGDGTIEADEEFFQQAKDSYGTTNSDSFIGSLDATYIVSDNTYLHSGYKKIETDNNIEVYAFDSDGDPWQDVEFETNEDGIVVPVLDASNPQTLTAYDYHNYKDKYYITGEHYFNDNLKVDLGYLANEEEDKGVHGIDEMEEDGYQLGFLYRPIERVRVNVDYEDVSDKDADATHKELDADIKWKATDNLTLSGKYKQEKEEDIGGAYLGDWASEVGLSTRHLPAEKEKENQTLSISYQPMVNLNVRFAYGNNSYETENQYIHYEDPDGYGPEPAEYKLVEYTTTMDNDMYNLNLAYQINEEFSTNFRGNYVDGTETFSTTNEEFNNEYMDYGLGLNYALPAYDDMNLTLDLRRVEYDEEESNIGAYGTDANDYEADIITLGLEGRF